MKNVNFVGGVNYERIDDEGLHIVVDDESRCLPVDTVIVCAGQESDRALFDALVTRLRGDGDLRHAERVPETRRTFRRDAEEAGPQPFVHGGQQHQQRGAVINASISAPDRILSEVKLAASTFWPSGTKRTKVSGLAASKVMPSSEYRMRRSVKSPSR